MTRSFVTKLLCPLVVYLCREAPERILDSHHVPDQLLVAEPVLEGDEHRVLEMLA